MNFEHLKTFQKEVYAPAPIKVFYVIQRFPNFAGYAGGGAERHLERLIQTTQDKYDESFQPTLYVANQQIAPTQLELPIISDPDRNKLIAELEIINAPDQILHLSDSYLMLYHPELFTQIAKFWQGPIIQRVTLLSRMEELNRKYAAAFQNYIAPITKFVSQSPEMTIELIKLGIAPEKIAEIENGVDTEFFEPATSKEKLELRAKFLPDIDPEARVFLAIARLTDPVKKIDLLIQNWQKTMSKHNAYLVLVGGYRLEETLSGSKVAELFETTTQWKSSEDKIIFTGVQPAETVKELLQLSDALLAPSILEGFSNVALEAMATGLPILAREGVSGYGKLILNRKTGLLFADDEALGREILELYSNATLRAVLAVAAREHIEKYYSVKVMIEKYRQLYKDVVNRKNKLLFP